MHNGAARHEAVEVNGYTLIELMVVVAVIAVVAAVALPVYNGYVADRDASVRS